MKKLGLLLGTEGVLCSTARLHRQAWENVLSLNHISFQAQQQNGRISRINWDTFRGVSPTDPFCGKEWLKY